MNRLIQDVRFAVRALSKKPLLTAAALICLALGIGANTAIFSVMYAVVLRSLPYPAAERLVVLGQLDDEGEASYAFAPTDYLALRDASRSLELLAGHRTLNLSFGGAGVPERISAQTVTPNFFAVFGVEPSRGRFFRREGDPAAAGVRSIVLSFGSWMNRFGGDPGVVGRTLNMNGEPHEVVGVAPESFRYPESAEMWVRSYREGVPEPPIDVGDDLASVSDLSYFGVIGRLAADASARQAQSEMDVLWARLAEARGDDSASRLLVAPLQEELIGDIKPVLIVLFGAVGLVLLIACANVANLLLARAAAREREIAVRAALGARPARLLRLLLTESLLLGLVGGLLGLLLAVWGVDALVRLAPTDIPRLSEIGVQSPVLLFALSIALLTGWAFGLVPALHAANPNLNECLKGGGRGSSAGRRRRRLSELLVVAEVALALVLLCGAGLLLKSFVRLRNVELGFEPENLLVMRLDLPESRYPEEADRAAFVANLVQRVRRVPGVQSAGATLALPFSGMAATLSYGVEGEPEVSDGRHTDYQVITPDYLRAMGIPLVAGRTFTEADDADALPVALVNESMARRHWPSGGAIGRRIFMGGDTLEIVGVVGDVRHFAYHRAPRPEVYAPFQQDAWPFLALVVRSAGDASGLVGPVRRAVLEVDADQPVYAANPMESVLAESIAERRFTLQLLALFAIVAILLALVGVYGVMSYTLSRRVHEMGIRMALGAAREDILRITLRWGLKLVMSGVAVGALAALALSRLIMGLLYGVSAADPMVYVSVTALLVAVAVAAAYLPAYRASRLDPTLALRYE